MLNPQSAMLECVSAAGDNVEVMEVINALAASLGCTVLTVKLALHAQWPCRPLRWWARLF
jgi:hypothetical protein